MNVRMSLLRKKPDWTTDEFPRILAQQAPGTLAARAPKLREYWQNRVTDRIQRGIDFARGSVGFDGFSQLYFDDAASGTPRFCPGKRYCSGTDRRRAALYRRPAHHHRPTRRGGDRSLLRPKREAPCSNAFPC